MKRIYSDSNDGGMHRIVLACNRCGAESKVSKGFGTDYEIEHGWIDARMPGDPEFTRLQEHLGAKVLIVDLCSACQESKAGA